jgi:hypothetical protein
MDDRTDPQGVLVMSQDRIDALSRHLADTTSRRRLLTVLGVGAAGTLVSAVGLTETLAKGQSITTSQLKDIRLSGRDKDQRFRGTLSVQEFQQQGSSIVAVVKVSGKVKKEGKKGSKRVSKTATVPVSLPGLSAAGVGAQAGVQAQATCQLLNLVLGPIDLNLLGLKLHVDRIVINLTAESGPGNLLGNLLCSIANLLNGGNLLGQLGQIVSLLNQILAAL